MPPLLLVLFIESRTMSRYRFNLSEGVRLIIMVLVFVIFAGLSIILIIALLSDWPKMLHGH